MIIGLSGPARAGKDTIGKLISDFMPGYNCYALADPIKSTVNGMYDWDERHSDGELKEVIDENLGFSPRQAYQKFGSEYGRALNPEHWLILADVKYKENYGKLIITDIRFDNEAEFIHERGGIVIRVHNPDTPEVSKHSSEAGLSVDLVDITIDNNIKDGMEVLTERVSNICMQLMGGIK